jgi:hypothetical protein
METIETIDVTPNYAAIFTRFERELASVAALVARKYRRQSDQAADDTLSEINSMLVSVNLMLGCASSTDMIERARTSVEAALQTVNAALRDVQDR